jgi:hypothetical protein
MSAFQIQLPYISTVRFGSATDFAHNSGYNRIESLERGKISPEEGEKENFDLYDRKGEENVDLYDRKGDLDWNTEGSVFDIVRELFSEEEKVEFFLPQNKSLFVRKWRQKGKLVNFSKLSRDKRKSIFNNHPAFASMNKNIKANFYKMPPKVQERYITDADALFTCFWFSMPEEYNNYHDSDKELHGLLCNIIRSRRMYLKQAKKYLKIFRKSLLTRIPFEETVPGNLNRLYIGYKKIFDSFTEWNAKYILRVAMYTQTRSFGCPTKKSLKQSILDFKAVVMETHDEFNYELTSGLLDSLFNKYGPSMSCDIPIRTVLSTSSCLDKSLKEGGGWAAAKQIVVPLIGNEFPSHNPVNGKFEGDSFTVTRNSIGRTLFNSALMEYYGGSPDIRVLRASAVGEPGFKARVITNGILLRRVLLHPFSKATISMVKSIPGAKGGLSKGKHGWYAARDMKVRVKVINSDFETATDYLNPLAGELVIEYFKNYELIPAWYADIVKDILCGKRYVIFDEKEGPIEINRGILMGDPGTKTVLTVLGSAILERISDWWRLVGDDSLHITKLENPMEAFVYHTKAVSFKLSESDTYESSEVCHFTEEYFLIPRFRSERVNSWLKHRTKGYLTYVDYPRIRLFFKIRKEVTDFQTEWTGKLKLLASEDQRIYYDAPAKGLYQMAKYIAINMLPHNGIGLYVPTFLGGIGMIPPTSNKLFLEEFLKFTNSYGKFKGVVGFCRSVLSEGVLDKANLVSTSSKHFYWEKPIVSTPELRYSIREDFDRYLVGTSTSLERCVGELFRKEGLCETEDDILAREMYRRYINELFFDEKFEGKENESIDPLLNALPKIDEEVDCFEVIEYLKGIPVSNFNHVYYRSSETRIKYMFRDPLSINGMRFKQIPLEPKDFVFYLYLKLKTIDGKIWDRGSLLLSTSARHLKQYIDDDDIIIEQVLEYNKIPVKKVILIITNDLKLFARARRVNDYDKHVLIRIPSNFSAGHIRYCIDKTKATHPTRRVVLLHDTGSERMMIATDFKDLKPRSYLERREIIERYRTVSHSSFPQGFY